MVRVPARRALPRLARDPMSAIEQIGRDGNGAILRLGLGVSHPYLVTHPDHTHHVLRDHETYQRDGMLWKRLRRLQGNGIGSVGAPWRASRRALQPLLTLRQLPALQPTMATAVAESLDELAARGAGSRPVEVVAEMMRITQRVLVRTFFGDRISATDSDRLGEAVTVALGALGARLLMPFVPDRVPMPGDRTFRRAVRVADEVIYPLVRRGRAGGERADLVGHLARATDEHGNPFDDQRIRNDLVAMFVAGTETTALTLSWLLLLLGHHPQVADRLAEEATAVVGGERPEPAHLGRLVYTRMVLQETLRLYPVGWIVPRMLATDDELGGVRLPAGATVVLSPYLTHRLPDFWEQPQQFDPERFAPDRSHGRHRFAYIPFGAGAHQCIGNHFSLVESQLVVAGLFSRWRPELAAPHPLVPRLAASLRPRGKPRMLLLPRR
jgi:cytochrome P450